MFRKYLSEGRREPTWKEIRPRDENIHVRVCVCVGGSLYISLPGLELTM